MARSTTRFICNACGAVQVRWMGKCPDCGAWDALEEHQQAAGRDDDRQRGSAALAPDAALPSTPKATPINEVVDARYPRLGTGIAELDRVLGGDEHGCGIVPGSAILLGGDPGIGKSTLLLQAAHSLAHQNRTVLYVTSEESAHQTRLRARRLEADSPNLFVLADTNLARILEQVRLVSPAVVVIDSIQMIYKGDLPAGPGTATQLRACCTELVYFAKSSGIAVVLVGHVTKEGQLAGPRLLEHMVDTVLYFEGDRYHQHRIVRAVKNRFGNTLEVGLFEMTEAGMQQLSSGTGLLAAEYQARSGSVVCPVLQGTRCLLVELQALTATGFLGSAKRKTSGMDGNRLAMLIAVLEKRGGLRLADQDVFVSSVGGVRIAEPAADLPLALAIAGAHYNRSLDRGVCAMGEIGLGGELRYVQSPSQRLAEAAKLGFTRVISPVLSVKPPAGCELIQVRTLDQAIQLLQ